MRRKSRGSGSLMLVCSMVAFVGCGAERSTAPPTGSRDVAIATPDGETLEATVAGEGPLGVVVAHGANANREHWYSAGGEIAATGEFTVVLLNLRGYQGSTGSPRTNQDVDIIAAIDWLTAQPGIDSVSLMGSSMGATSVLDTAGQRADQVRSVVALSPPQQSASMDARAAVPNLSMPTLLFAAKGDTTFVESTSALAEALGIEPRIMVGSGHGTGMFGDNPEMVAEIVDFLLSAA